MGKVVVIENSKKHYKALVKIFEEWSDSRCWEVIPNEADFTKLAKHWSKREFKKGTGELIKLVQKDYKTVDAIILDVALAGETIDNLEGLVDVLPLLRCPAA